MEWEETEGKEKGDEVKGMDTRRGEGGEEGGGRECKYPLKTQ